MSNDLLVTAHPPAWDPYDAPRGISVESAAIGADGMELVVSFIGAPDRGSQPCGADYEAQAVASATAVVVIIIVHPNSPFQTCPSIGAARTATVRLAEALGDRAVLEVKQGLPIPVTR